MLYSPVKYVAISMILYAFDVDDIPYNAASLTMSGSSLTAHLMNGTLRLRWCLADLLVLMSHLS